MRVCVHGKDVLSLLYSRPLSRVSKCSNMSMNASKNFLLQRILSLPHSEDFRLQMYKELFIPTTHGGTTRGYYGLNKNIKKALMREHQDL